MRRPIAPTAAAVLLVSALLAAAPPARAEDHLLAIGGGPTASSNEASIEANMRYLQRMLDGVDFPQERCHLLFADGDDRTYPDVQYVDDEPVPPLNRMLAVLHDSADTLNYQYRPSDLPHVAGPATVDAIDDWFDTTGTELGEDDRLLIYFTGHGGGGSDEHPRRTTMALWEDDQLTVREFARRLDRLDPAVETVLIMVQCHSGGFANVVFDETDREAGPAAHTRVGFFAAPHDRVAAGCTPEINEADYEDYSTHFFAALFGRDRLNEPLDYDADLNDDGTVTLAEAHANVLLRADTIDLPMTTSDAYLRVHSRLPESRDRSLLHPETDYRRLHAAAEPHHQAVLDGLSEQLDLQGRDRIEQAREEVGRLNRRHQGLARRYQRARKAFDTARQQVARDLSRRWPLLEHRWQPDMAETLRDRGDGILNDAKAHEDYKPMLRARHRLHDVEEERGQLRRQMAKHRRLLQVAETVALAANLEHVADDAQRRRYRDLRELEDKPLLTP